jgi:acetyltransferase-like isoleucine patch superfamily enzyme
MIPEQFKKRWTEFWMRRAGLSRSGRIATRLAVVFAPPFQRRKYLKFLNPRGYVSPEAIIDCPDLKLGENVFIGDRVMLIQVEDGGPIEIGDRANLWGDSQIESGRGGRIVIGPDSRVNRGVHVISWVAPILIGRDVGLSANCMLYSFNHGTAPGQPYIDQPLVTKGPIIIEDHAWIGMGAMVLSGVKIGKHAVVSAGSVVIKDVPENAIVFGVPARVVGKRSETESTQLQTAADKNP